MNLQQTQTSEGLESRTWFILTFSLFCFSTSGGLAPTATVVFKHIASESMISGSQDDLPPVELFWLLLQNWFSINMFCYHVYL